MAHPFTDEQVAKIKDALANEPCLFNARHYLSHSVHRTMALDTMAAWLNEVGGKQLADGAMIAEILGVAAPGAAPETPAEPAPDVWREQREALGL